MDREIVTFPMQAAQVAEELVHFVDFFGGRGSRHCAVVFGFAWGNDYYSGSNAWNEVSLPLAGLIHEVRLVEKSGIGRLGHDDLFVRIPPLELTFQFCHEADIHIEFSEPTEITESFYLRWKDLGYTPREFRGNAEARTLLRTN